jgi:hypothetical protein
VPRVAGCFGVNVAGALPVEESGAFSAMGLDKSACVNRSQELLNPGLEPEVAEFGRRHHRQPAVPACETGMTRVESMTPLVFVLETLERQLKAR